MSEMPSRVEARRALLAVLTAHQDAGRRVPCLSAFDAAAWTSDDPDDQALAARLCEPCPGLTACRLYGTTFPKEAGTYGGLTEHDRRARVGRPKRARDQRAS